MFYIAENDDHRPDAVAIMARTFANADRFIETEGIRAVLFSDRVAPGERQHHFVAMAADGKPHFGTIIAKDRAADSTIAKKISLEVASHAEAWGLARSENEPYFPDETGQEPERHMKDFAESVLHSLDPRALEVLAGASDLSSARARVSLLRVYANATENLLEAADRWFGLYPWSFLTVNEAIDHQLDPVQLFAKFLIGNYPHRSVTPSMLRMIELTAGVSCDADGDFLIKPALLASDTLPLDWLPKTTLEDAIRADNEDGDDTVVAEWECLTQLLADIEKLGMITGRTSGDMFRGFKGDWVRYAYDLADIAGVEAEGHSDALFYALIQITEVVDGFVGQVIKPMMAAHGRDTYYSLFDFDPVNGIGLHAAEAFRILMGSKALSGMAETARKWHARSTELAEAELAVGASKNLSWPSSHRAVKFKDEKGRAFEVRPLNSALQFLDEGRVGPDSQGIAGMSHCIASYARQCFGVEDRFVVSVRQLEPKVKRLSTALIEYEDWDPNVVQHHGPGNARPSLIALDLLEQYVRRLPPMPETNRLTARLPYDCFYDPTADGAVDQMLRAWAPLLPRSLRTMDGKALLARFRHVEIDEEDRFLKSLDGGPRVAVSTEQRLPPEFDETEIDEPPVPRP